MKDPDYYKSDRPDIIELIPKDARRVLDVGCGFGNMARRIKQRQNAEVVGIESEKQAAAKAADNIDKLIIGDAESLDLPFEPGYFDCIVYGDVLEHMIDPWKVVRHHARYLGKEGLCIASIPNISHYSIIKGLLKGRWVYDRAGILDQTHLRFFTLDAIRKMFEEAGYRIIEVKRHMRASMSKKLLNILLAGALKEMMTEQYVIIARRV